MTTADSYEMVVQLLKDLLDYFQPIANRAKHKATRKYAQEHVDKIRAAIKALEGLRCSQT